MHHNHAQKICNWQQGLAAVLAHNASETVCLCPNMALLCSKRSLDAEGSWFLFWAVQGQQDKLKSTPDCAITNVPGGICK